MNRREALASLTALAGATGMSVTPVTAKDAEHVALVLLKVSGAMSSEASMRLKAQWDRAVEDTPLQGIKAVVVDDGIEVEFVRR